MTHRILIVALALVSQTVFAWGKRGHQMVGETAALVVASEPKASFMKARAYDFGYYNNVPDFIWKRPATYEIERDQHYINFEIFERAFKARPDIKDPLSLSRAEFDKTFPEIPSRAGRSFWRIREMFSQLEKATADLKASSPEKKESHRKLQERWLVIAGTMGHYIADLAMPLHVSDNYDGQLTDQKGLHHYFEEDMVDELYPDLAVKVLKRAKQDWPAFKKRVAGMSVSELVQDQAAKSLKAAPTLLKLDKGRKREQSPKEARRYESLLVERLSQGSLYLAEIYRRNLGFEFDDDKFFFFSGEPEFIKPGQ